MIKIYGASDDLIEIDGDTREEFGADSDRTNYVALSNGMIFALNYDNDGLWRINCLYDNGKKYTKKDGTPLDDTNDEVEIDDNIKWILHGYNIEYIKTKGGLNER